jgi:hypothetical protein
MAKSMQPSANNANKLEKEIMTESSDSVKIIKQKVEILNNDVANLQDQIKTSNRVIIN